MRHATLAARIGLLLTALIMGGCAVGSSAPAPSSGTSTAAPGSPAATADPSFPATVVDAETLTGYDASAPLDLREEAAVQEQDGVAVHDVSWVSPLGGRATAWLVVPEGDGPHAGLVYLHGSETWRDDFLDEAVAMAHGGAVSIVIDAPFARLGENRRSGLQSYANPERERTMTAQAIVDVRRAYDVLLSRDDVDPERLGFVGHSWGASLGVVLAAVDQRPAALVLICGRPSWTGFLETTTANSIQVERKRIGEPAWNRYLELMAPLDAMAQIGQVDAARLYLQYGSEDDVVPVDVSAELIAAAPAAQSDLYPAGHALNDEATADRVGWLVQRLSLEPIGPDQLAQVGLPDE